MKSLSVFVSLVVLWSLFQPVSAQEFRQVQPIDRADARKAAPSEWKKLHITDDLAASPAGQRALEEFRVLKAAGQLPGKRSAASADTVGQVERFKVFNRTTSSLDTLEFVLMAIDPTDSPRFQIWVETSDELTDDANAIQRLTEALGESTPEGSINPEAGIIDNDELIFGDPPNVDGDGITDVLMLDIRDGFDGETVNTFIGGFVAAVDLSAGGNNRDILYLDTNPTLSILGIDEVALTAAHEYQHLIHFNYDLGEGNFVNEGLSEWAEVALGYIGRTISYLGDETRYNVPLLAFSDDNSLDDRQRGSMFINYIADRFGPFEAGKITREPTSNSEGLTNSLAQIDPSVSLGEIVLDFHAANFFNDVSIDPIYGYTTSQRQGLRAVPSAVYDGRTSLDTPPSQANVRPGGVQYLVWNAVEDISFVFDASANDAANLSGKAFVFGSDGSFDRVELVSFTGEDLSFDGMSSRVVVVLTNTNLDGASAFADYSATWSSSQQLVSLANVQYDNSQFVTQLFFTIGSGEEGELPSVAAEFVVPFTDRGPTLDQVSLAPLFINQFADQNGSPIGSPEDPRDLTFAVWGPSGAGVPGDTLFTLELNDPRPYAGLTSLSISFFDLDLSPYAARLSALPDTIYIGYAEAGTDDNEFVVGVSPYAVENVSFIGQGTEGPWVDLWDVQFQGSGEDEFPVANTTIPIRARFAIPSAVSVDEPLEVPDRVALHQNFPNPFNPTTSIRYTLPQSDEVRLSVFDILGREVAILIDGVQASGEHTVQLDATQWASGLYFYSLETPGQKLTRRMVLLK